MANMGDNWGEFCAMGEWLLGLRCPSKASLASSLPPGRKFSAEGGEGGVRDGIGNWYKKKGMILKIIYKMLLLRTVTPRRRSMLLNKRLKKRGVGIFYMFFEKRYP